jgi:hypothetical protein
MEFFWKNNHRGTKIEAYHSMSRNGRRDVAGLSAL